MLKCNCSGREQFILFGSADQAKQPAWEQHHRFFESGDAESYAKGLERLQQEPEYEEKQ
jgi:hypothetical protein